MKVSIHTFSVRIPFITLDKFMSMPAENKADLYDAFDMSVKTQLASQGYFEKSFCSPLALVFEYNFSYKMDCELQEYIPTAFCMLRAMFPNEKNDIHIDQEQGIGFIPKVAGFSQRIGRENVQEDTLTIFLHESGHQNHFRVVK